jgi:oligopeptide/dipeptide ABC transporter ATP-binding protein
VDGVSLAISGGETAALVGESGCGKSATALALTKLLPQPPAFYAGGDILFRGRNVLAMAEAELRELRGKEIAYVFQEPAGSLNPVVRVDRQIAEALRLHRPEADACAEVLRLLDLVGIADAERKMKSYPHQLSGGQQQRVMIAMALAGRPKLLIADEPTTALDVTIQAQILELLASLQREFGMAILLITHNLGLVAHLARTLYVMYAGRIVESGPAAEVLRDPKHPYTRALMDAVPRLKWGGERLMGIEGMVPSLANLPSGCKFHPRCPKCRQLCREAEPAWEHISSSRGVRCHYWKD